MMEKWDEYKISQKLVEALKADTLIAGISAGTFAGLKKGFVSIIKLMLT